MPKSRLELARVLVTIPGVILAIVPPLADFNASHAANPSWPAHARLHTVWLVCTSSSLALLALFLLWSRSRELTRDRVCLAAALLGTVLGGFFVAGATQGLYGGAFTDPNGVAVRIGPLDANLAGFSVMAVILAAGVAVALRSASKTLGDGVTDRPAMPGLGASALDSGHCTIREARRADLEVVAAWLGSAADCRLWAGHRVPFPVDLGTLPRAIEWDASESWCVTEGGSVVAFGQLVPKPGDRLHLSRVIAAPRRRGAGLGRIISTHLLETALSRAPAVVSLNVIRDNARAIQLYRSLGFVAAERPRDEPESTSAYMEHGR